MAGTVCVYKDVRIFGTLGIVALSIMKNIVSGEDAMGFNLTLLESIRLYTYNGSVHAITDVYV